MVRDLRARNRVHQNLNIDPGNAEQAGNQLLVLEDQSKLILAGEVVLDIS